MATHSQWALAILTAVVILGVTNFTGAQATAGKPIDKPSRKPAPDCVWEKFSDAALHLDAWVQRCNYGSRKIDFLAVGQSLAIRYSDGGDAPDPVIDVLDLLPAETPEHGIQRLFAARTDKALADRCQLSPYRGATPAPAGVKRYTFVPNAAYWEELEAKADPNEVGDPPCGDWGDAPDGIQYFEAQPASGVAKVLFVRIGQDEPLFDEDSLRLR
jgi:hypothetical protein